MISRNPICFRVKIFVMASVIEEPILAYNSITSMMPIPKTKSIFAVFLLFFCSEYTSSILRAIAYAVMAASPKKIRESTPAEE